MSPLSGDNEDRRQSDASDTTLYNDSSPDGKASPTKKGSDDNRYSLSSYRHPHDIRPPGEAYSPNPRTWNRQSAPPAYSGDDEDPEKGGVDPGDEKGDETCDLGDREDRRRGFLSNYIDLYANEAENSEDGGERRATGQRAGMHRRTSSSYGASRPGYGRFDSCTSAGSQVIDPDDPTITGERKKTLDDPEDIERACMKQMNYKARRKYQQRIRIEFNITCTFSTSRLFQRC